MVSAVKNEPARLSDWLLYEIDEVGRYSRENITIGANQTLVCGSVVGLNDAGTAYVAYDDTAPDGAVAGGILVEAVTTGAGETKPAAIVARHARINPKGLAWGALAAPAQAAALADLAAKGIVTVTEA